MSARAVGVVATAALVGWMTPATTMSAEVARSEVAQAAAMVDSALALDARGDTEGCAGLLEDALLLHRRAGDPDRLEVARVLHHLGETRHALGDFAGAAAAHSEALDLRREQLGDDHLDVASSWFELASVSRARGDYARAELELRAAIRIQRQRLGDEHLETAFTYQALAAVLRQRGDYATSERLFRRVLDIQRRVLAESDPRLALTLGQYANVLSDQGDLAAAGDLRRQVLFIQRDRFGDSDPRVSSALHNLALHQRRMRNYDEAVRLYREAIALRQTAYGEGHPRVATSLLGLANALTLLERYPEAEAAVNRAMSIHRSLSEPDRAQIASCLHTLAGIYRDADRLADAETRYRQALDIRREIYGDAHANVANTRRWLGYVVLLQGRTEEANRIVEAAASSYEGARLRTASTAKRATFQASPYPLLAATYLELGQTAKAWEVMELAGARVLADVLRAYSQVPDAGSPGAAGLAPLSLDDVQRLIDPGTAIVGWLDLASRTRQASWGYVVRNQGEVHWVPMKTRVPGSTAPPLTTFKRNLRSAAAWPLRVPLEEEVLVTCRQLWDLRMAPLEPYLEGVERLVVVPAGAMLGLPVETLGSDRTGWAGERFRISYAPSATVFARLRTLAPRMGEGRALLVGNPETKDDLSPLPRAEEEVARIAPLLTDALLLLGTAAHEETLATLAVEGILREFDTLHFATHARVHQDRPALSALVLSAGAAADVLPGERVPADGLLTVDEILASWRLDADLVTLSGCETALGRAVPGEGYMGLAHTLFQVGARNLLVSLWKVDDRATALLMEHFYTALKDSEGHPTMTAALREAKRRVRTHTEANGRRPFAHPAYWSGFLLFGAAD